MIILKIIRSQDSCSESWCRNSSIQPTSVTCSEAHECPRSPTAQLHSQVSESLSILQICQLSWSDFFLVHEVSPYFPYCHMKCCFQRIFSELWIFFWSEPSYLYSSSHESYLPFVFAEASFSSSLLTKYQNAHPDKWPGLFLTFVLSSRVLPVSILVESSILFCFSCWAT